MCSGYYPPCIDWIAWESSRIALTRRMLCAMAHSGALPGKPVDTGETYDLVVVGGGISGLSAAHFYRKSAGPKARILILDNHDDFGGHAKRNEFRVGKNFRLGFGGTFSIESPAPYSAVAKSVIEELGIDVPSYSKYVDKGLYRSLGLAPKIFFDKETFAADKLVVNPLRGGATETSDKPDGNDRRSGNYFRRKLRFPIKEKAISSGSYLKTRIISPA